MYPSPKPYNYRRAVRRLSPTLSEDEAAPPTTEELGLDLSIPINPQPACATRAPQYGSIDREFLQLLERPRSGFPDDVRKAMQIIIEFSEAYVHEGSIEEQRCGLRFWSYCINGYKELFPEWRLVLEDTPYLCTRVHPEVRARFLATPRWPVEPMAAVINGRWQPQLAWHASYTSHPVLPIGNSFVFQQAPNALVLRRFRAADDSAEIKDPKVQKSTPVKAARHDSDSEAKSSSGSEFHSDKPSPEPEGIPWKVKKDLARRAKKHYCWPAARIALSRIDYGYHDETFPEIHWNVDNGLESYCTPPNVDITFGGNFVISAEEILTYFPLHIFAWRDVGARLFKHWGVREIRNFVYHSRDLKDIKTLERSRIYHQMIECVKWYHRLVIGDEGNTSTSDRTYEEYDDDKSFLDDWRFAYQNNRPEMGEIKKVHGNKGSNRELIDYTLFDLGEGVQVHPTGRGAQVLTRAILHCRLHYHNNIRLSELTSYVTRVQRNQGVDLMAGVIPYGDPDDAMEAACNLCRGEIHDAWRHKFPRTS
ncbi:hypothetical protein BS50DRAFT_584386 [Corynespora cassiicola Philippines]|uniref:Uncharacterized protein n=1 Tax=Corynespora cassiicola Philippines TaxID=1448308 RepID=A0A2T2NZH0_CORCC|nr:hypothetical protein BS50DRAFT_584386 [Corynespora cassiicola Philippines]